jgi:hypothetical protein
MNNGCPHFQHFHFFMLAVVVLYAFRTSLGGQLLFGRASLED